LIATIECSQYGPKHVAFIEGIIKSLLYLTVICMPVYFWIVCHSMSLVNWVWRCMNYSDKYLQNAHPVFVDCYGNLETIV